MKLFDMHYIDKEGNVVSEDGEGTWEFKHRILAPTLLIIILPFAIVATSIFEFFRWINRMINEE